ncbi:MAG: AraC family transcriptional regulator [Lachnospiraceae bacterium]|nr:AraC family transcriptional regulator [Lachnospiraceae bacterium]
MYMNTAYLKNTLISPRVPLDQEDLNTPLRILCCGVYRIYSYPDLSTDRPEGRLDYQLLYFHSGQGHFHFDNSEQATVVRAGQMVLFSPGEPQVYHYYAADKTEVYWVHFTGNQVEHLLMNYQIPRSGNVFKSGVYVEYKDIFLRMITELQLCKLCYEENLSLMLQELLLLLHRNSKEKNTKSSIQREIEQATLYFSENYNKEIHIQDYAKEHFLSSYYFSRSFKQYTGYTPAQYILSVRITNAQSLLGTSDCSINEIAHMVGYEDPLYFSRIFKKHVGFSPTEYRVLLQK